ncbi:MAG: hypothetical protein LPH21_07615 [Shewanella sp.]|nr:hypothetical protein [Shewanella sp.]MCF1430514.1 hypothetical protein [Shewanella sp.]MCF1457425.1 hypothetical protein [Shewanella sp.]
MYAQFALVKYENTCQIFKLSPLICVTFKVYLSIGKLMVNAVEASAKINADLRKSEAIFPIGQLKVADGRGLQTTDAIAQRLKLQTVWG